MKKTAIRRLIAIIAEKCLRVSQVFFRDKALACRRHQPLVGLRRRLAKIQGCIAAWMRATRSRRAGSAGTA